MSQQQDKQPVRTPPFHGDGTKVARSPEVHPDGLVTFRHYAPKASEVYLVAGGLRVTLGRDVPMIKDADGMWSVTVGPLEPEVYDYAFAVDGSLRTVDNVNPNTAVQRWGPLCWFEVPPKEPQYYSIRRESRDAPRGTVHVHWYDSAPISDAICEDAAGGAPIDVTRPLYVYTPPGYDDNPSRTYPVFYLLHGAGQLEVSWTDRGRANFIMDNLLAEHKIEPMIVVMPYGHVRRMPVVDERAHRNEDHALFQQDLFEEILPLVEARYRVRAGARHRAIAGLSMGGFQSLHIGLTHLDRFAWIGAFSGGVRDVVLEQAFADLIADPASTEERLKLLWIGCDEADFVYPMAKRLMTFLDEHSVRYTFRSLQGGHSFLVWRRCLYEFAQLLFQK